MRAATAVDTCAITWWQGYVRGQFQAVIDTDPPTLAAESSTIRHRRGHPEQTEENLAAVDALTKRLVDQGWTLADEGGEEWFEHAFTRSSLRPLDDLDEADELTPGETVDLELLETLQSELAEAREAAERERRARLDAEAPAARPRTVVEAPAPQAEPARGSRPTSRVALALYALAVAGAGSIFLVGFHSEYAAAVAALAVAAVCLGVDSWRLARHVA